MKESLVMTKEFPLALKESWLMIKESRLIIRESSLAMTQFPLMMTQSCLMMTEFRLAMKEFPVTIKEFRPTIKEIAATLKETPATIKQTRPPPTASPTAPFLITQTYNPESLAHQQIVTADYPTPTANDATSKLKICFIKIPFQTSSNSSVPSSHSVTSVSQR
jgi:hypothetical protein